MTQTLRSIAFLTLGLLAVGALGGLWFEGGRFALGVVATAGLMLGSMGLGALAMRRAEGAAGLPTRLLVLPYLLKLPLILVVGWFLLRTFPPVSVILGGSVLVTAISIHAALGMFLPSPARKA